MCTYAIFSLTDFPTFASKEEITDIVGYFIICSPVILERKRERKGEEGKKRAGETERKRDTFILSILCAHSAL